MRNLIILAVVVAFLAVAGFRIYTKVTMGKRSFGAVYAVGVSTLKKEKVDIILDYQGTIEGDPQVKVYPSVGGKFQQNSVREGDFVHQDQTISLINRDIVGSDYQLAQVNSPINGMVTKLYYIDRGTPINPNNPIADVANISKIKVVLNVGQADLFNLSVGKKAKIYFSQDTNKSLDAVVDSVTPFIDSDTLTGQVTVKAPNINNLFKVGMTANVNILVGSTNTFMVPDEAVLADINQATVYLYVNGKAKLVKVQTGYAADARTEIISDELHEGDVLITQGTFKLFEGAAVRIQGDTNARPGGGAGTNGYKGNNSGSNAGKDSPGNNSGKWTNSGNYTNRDRYRKENNGSAPGSN